MIKLLDHALPRYRQFRVHENASFQRLDENNNFSGKSGCLVMMIYDRGKWQLIMRIKLQ